MAVAVHCWGTSFMKHQPKHWVTLRSSIYYSVGESWSMTICWWREAIEQYFFVVFFFHTEQDASNLRLWMQCPWIWNPSDESYWKVIIVFLLESLGIVPYSGHKYSFFWVCVWHPKVRLFSWALPSANCTLWCLLYWTTEGACNVSVCATTQIKDVYALLHWTTCNRKLN